MVAFATAKAKSIFSKLRFTQVSQRQEENHGKSKIDKLSTKKEKSSNYFLEAIKSGGIWLS